MQTVCHCCPHTLCNIKSHNPVYNKSWTSLVEQNRGLAEKSRKKNRFCQRCFRCPVVPGDFNQIHHVRGIKKVHGAKKFWVRPNACKLVYPKRRSIGDADGSGCYCMESKVAQDRQFQD